MRDEVQHLSRVIVETALKTAVLVAASSNTDADRREEANW